MDIKDYTSFFHDGSIISIDHTGNQMVISMESAELTEEDLKDSIILSENHRIRGKLHIEGVKNITENNKRYHFIFKMKYEDAEIFHFEYSQNTVEFQIKWNSYPPDPCIKDFSTIEIEAEKIYWENIPDLADPFR
jgi:hypothetical protein